MDFSEVTLVSYVCQNTHKHRGKSYKFTQAWTPEHTKYTNNIHTQKHTVCGYSRTDFSPQESTQRKHMRNLIQEQGVRAAELSCCPLVEKNRRWVGGFANNHCNVITTILTKVTLEGHAVVTATSICAVWLHDWENPTVAENLAPLTFTRSCPGSAG